MSSKVDTLLKRATTFEKLALYGDRKAYLSAIAQVGVPDVNALLAAINATRSAAVKSINNFWRQDPGNFPMEARTSYSALAYPQTDITSATGEELNSGFDQLITALNSVYRGLSGTDNARNQQFATQTVFPTLERLQQQVQQYKDALGSIPSPGPEQQEEVGAPASAAKPAAKPVYDYATVVTLQKFLNNMLQDEIIAGKRSPLVVDGDLGPDTTAALKMWAAKVGLPANNVQQLINTALKSGK